MTPTVPQTNSFVMGRLALAALLSEDRINAAVGLVRENRTVRGDGPAPDPLTALSDKLGGKWAGASPADGHDKREAIFEKIRDELADQDRRWSGEDIEAALRALAVEAADGLLGWLKVLVEKFDLKVRFETDQPIVDVNALHGWLTCTEVLDADSLLCFQFARSLPISELERMTRWHIIAKISDRDLARLTSRGVSDLHIHQGALRNAHSLWQELITGARATDSMDIDKGDPPDVRERLRQITAMMADRKSVLGIYYDPVAPSKDDPIDPKRNLQRMRHERAMLVRAFIALDGKLRHGKWDDARRLEHALDFYIHTKSGFIARRTQGITTNPGLNKFRREYKKLQWLNRRANLPVNLASLRVDWHDYLLCLLQGEDLRRVELRFAPVYSGEPRGPTFAKTVGVWEELEDELKLARNFPRLDIRFAIHFKRSLDLKSDRSGFQAVQQLRKQIADEAAALCEFRHQVWPTKDKHFVPRIARVDFAGQERDVTPDIAAFAMNLVRGDAEARAELKSGEIDPLVYERWLQFERMPQAQHEAALPALGLTCHAGEDFAHPLEGLHAMISAANSLKMREGDTIGHGLAAGVDVREFNRYHGQYRLTEAGQQFDALLWLYVEMLKSGSAEFGAQVIELEEWLWQRFAALYPQVDPPASLMMLADIGSFRAEPLWRANGVQSEKNRKHPAGLLVERERRDEGTFRARAFREPLAPLHAMLESAVEWAQGRVLRTLAGRGILLEFNPSSNWRMSGAAEPKDIPIVAMLMRYPNDLLASINTDNPGVYATRIENEYAVLFSGLTSAGATREQALTILERLRVLGLERVFWPERILPPQNAS